MILTLELSKLTHSLLNRKMPTPKPSKYLKDGPGVPSHTQMRNFCSKHRRDNTHHWPSRDFPSPFFGFLQKTSKISESYKTHFNSIQLTWRLQQLPHMQVLLQPWLSQISLAIIALDKAAVPPSAVQDPSWAIHPHPAPAGALGGNVWEKAVRFQTQRTPQLAGYFYFPPLSISAVQASFSRVLSGRRQNKQPSIPGKWLAQSEGMWHLLGIKPGSGLHWREALLAACQALEQWWHPVTTLASRRGQADKKNKFIQVHSDVVDDRNSKDAPQKRRVFMEPLTSASQNWP